MKNHGIYRVAVLLLLCGLTMWSGCSNPADPTDQTTTTSLSSTTDTAITSSSATGEETGNSTGSSSAVSVTGGQVTTTVGKTTTTVADGPVIADKGLIRVGFVGSTGTIGVDKTTKTITIPVRGDEDLAGQLPTMQVSSGYTISLTKGADLNSTLVYTVSDGKTTEQWTVTTKEDYTDVEEATSLSLMSVFGKGAVLQRDREVRVWGGCDGADMVVVEFAEQRKRGAVKDGRWEVTLDPMPANKKAQTLTVSTAGETVENKSILVGDVWFCSGQSNMEYWPLNAEETKSLSAVASSKNIRYFDVPETWNKRALNEFETVVTWKNAATYASQQWSMYALAFAYALQQELDVPIGIVVSAEGGSLIEYFLPDSCLIAAGTSRTTAQRGTGIKQGVGTGMYNSMVYPLKGLSVKGILWYQGEANTNATSDYTLLFNQYAKHYRELFNDPDLPIITTQLPQYDSAEYPNWISFRLKQWDIAQKIDNVHIVSTIDMGEAEDIHPSDKWPLGMRAADLVLNKVYGKSTPGESAYPKSVSVSDNTITIRFQDAESGLKLSDGSTVRELYGITAAGGKVAPTSASLNGDTLVLTMSQTVTRVDYAMANVPNVNLYTGNGLPVAPFSLEL